MAAMNNKAGWIARLNARRVDRGGWQLLNPKLTGLFDERALQNSSTESSSQHQKAKGHKLVVGVKQAWIKQQTEKQNHKNHMLRTIQPPIQEVEP